MRHVARPIASIFLGVLATACSSSSVPELETVYEAEIGRASHTQILESVPRILNRYAYEIERLEDHQSTLYLQTRWEVREPFGDEVVAGYSQANTRILIEARAITSSRGDPSGAIQVTAVWRVRLRAENRLRRPLGSEWEEPKLSPMFREYMDKIARDLKTEFESRFR
jgi:hypothetical protein